MDRHTQTFIHLLIAAPACIPFLNQKLFIGHLKRRIHEMSRDIELASHCSPHTDLTTPLWRVWLSSRSASTVLARPRCQR
mmetsp:Transcript_29198/g.72763  ORF Transcript_29198/g.72763 Transcript_29198/m.72763 type:complete len:80 (+) Transcript_29198:1146-1385(+)